MLDNFQDLKDAVSSVAPDLTSGQKGQVSANLDRVQVFLSLLTIFILPFFFLPITIEWFDGAKTLFLGVFVGLIGLITLLKLLISPKETLVTTVIDKIVLLVLTTLAVSSWLAANRINSAVSETTQWLYLAVLFFLFVNTFRKQESWIMAYNLLTWSIGVLGAIQAFEVILGLISRFSPAFGTTVSKIPLLTGFTPVGTPYTLVILLVLSLPLVVGKYYSEKMHNKTPNKATVILLVLTLIGVAATAWTLYNTRPILMDADTGRKIATGVLGKSYQNALFGVGPGEYVTAFTQYRSADFNNNPFWNFNFTTANSFAFYALTTGGLALVVSLVLGIFKVYSVAKKRLQAQVAGPTEKGIFFSLALAVVLMVFFPIPYLALWLIFVLLALLFSWYRSQEVESFVKDLKLNNRIQTGIVALGLVLVGLSLYGVGASYTSDVLMRQALEAAVQNRGVDTYNLQVRAAQVTPWKDSIRVSLSQTNLALADSLASQPNLTDQQKQTVVQLVQQAILEARNAAALSSNSATNWENLALIYRNLINFAQGADQWAVLTQNQAITLDPSNPRLRLDMGGIFYSQNNWTAAAQNFAAAADLKPDYANPHYNLAQALKKLNIKDQAIQQLQLTAQLICASPTNKADCDTVNAEITELNKPAETAGTQTPEIVAETATKKTAPSQLASPSGESSNLPKAQTQPPVKITSPSGELAQ